MTHTWLPDDPFLLPGFCSAAFSPSFSVFLCSILLSPLHIHLTPLLHKTLTVFSSRLHFVLPSNLLPFDLFMLASYYGKLSPDTYQMS